MAYVVWPYIVMAAYSYGRDRAMGRLVIHRLTDVERAALDTAPQRCAAACGMPHWSLRAANTGVRGTVHTTAASDMSSAPAVLNPVEPPEGVGAPPSSLG